MVAAPFCSHFSNTVGLKPKPHEATLFFFQDPCTFRLSVGGSGGSHIPTAVIQTLINILSLDDTLEGAVERPRVHHQLIPNVAEAEGGVVKCHQGSFSRAILTRRINRS